MTDLMSWTAPIIVAFITGAFSYLSVSRSMKANHDKLLVDIKAEQDKFALTTQNQISSIQKDIHRLEEKQDKHNAVIERTYKLEQKVDDIEKRLNRTEVR